MQIAELLLCIKEEYGTFQDEMGKVMTGLEVWYGYNTNNSCLFV